VSGNPDIRRFDIPWLIMDASLAKETWGWAPQTTVEEILTEIASHAEQHPSWLELSGLS
jgi:CDP-paratose 2-epimerase